MVLRREKKRGRKKSFIFVSDFLGQKLSKGERCDVEPCLISACRSASVSTGTCPTLGRRLSQTLLIARHSLPALSGLLLVQIQGFPCGIPPLGSSLPVQTYPASSRGRA